MYKEFVLNSKEKAKESVKMKSKKWLNARVVRM